MGGAALFCRGELRRAAKGLSLDRVVVVSGVTGFDLVSRSRGVTGLLLDSRPFEGLALLLRSSFGGGLGTLGVLGLVLGVTSSLGVVLGVVFSRAVLPGVPVLPALVLGVDEPTLGVLLFSLAASPRFIILPKMLTSSAESSNISSSMPSVAL